MMLPNGELSKGSELSDDTLSSEVVSGETMLGEAAGESDSPPG